MTTITDAHRAEEQGMTTDTEGTAVTGSMLLAELDRLRAENEALKRIADMDAHQAWQETLAELAEGKGELRLLMDSIWQREYRNNAPDWQPLPDLVGMVTQTDNMYADVRGQRDKALHDLAEARKEKALIVAWLEERERESLNGHVVAGIRIAIERGEHRSKSDD